jgi:hypothetical protein
MLALVRSSIALVGLSLAALSAKADVSADLDPDLSWYYANTVEELVLVLEDWLDQETKYESVQTRPTIKIIAAKQAQEISGTAKGHSGRTRGLYDAESQTIFLVEPWTPKNVNDVSVLLHELVHHRQAGHHFYCPAAQEKDAYRIQDAWLNLRGQRAKVNWIAVVLMSGCSPRDIHP